MLPGYLSRVGLFPYPTDMNVWWSDWKEKRQTCCFPGKKCSPIDLIFFDMWTTFIIRYFYLIRKTLFTAANGGRLGFLSGLGTI
jgi:hypothetical protein